jgi:hypothetical protein
MCKLMKTDTYAAGIPRMFARRWALAALLLLAACGNNATLEWTEDVKLPDGRVITLERYVEFKGGASQLGEPSTESLQRFKFKHPVTGGTVTWESSKERGLLKTVAIWMEASTPVLLTKPAYGGDEWLLKCPNPPYLLFAYADGEWRSRQLSQIGLERLRSNMTTNAGERRNDIEARKRRLSATDTSESYAFLRATERVPFVLQFKDMPIQTFDPSSCDYPSRLHHLIISGSALSRLGTTTQTSSTPPAVVQGTAQDGAGSSRVTYRVPGARQDANGARMLYREVAGASTSVAWIESNQPIVDLAGDAIEGGAGNEEHWRVAA